MLSKKFISIVSSLLAATSLILSASAAASTKTFGTSVTLFNAGTSTANVAMSYLLDNGSTWTAAPGNTNFTIPANAKANIIQWSDGTLTSGKGSAVASSDQELLSIVQVQENVGQTATRGSYIGKSSGATTIYFPLAQKRRSGVSGEMNSIIVIQNLGTSNATIEIDLIKSAASPGSNFTKTGITIAPNVSYYYDLTEESDTNLVLNWTGAAVVRSTNSQPITAVTNMFLGTNQMWTFNGYYANELSTTWYVPTFASRRTNGFSTPVTIQNLSGSTIASGAISMNCIGDGVADFSISSTASVDNNQSIGFNPINNMNIPTNWAGACTITAPGNVAVLSQLRFDLPSVVSAIEEQGAGYKPAPGSLAGTKVVFPTIIKQVGGYATVATIMNIGASSADVTITYTPTSGSPVVVNTTIPAGGRLQLNQSNSSDANIPVGWTGSLTAVSTNGQNLYGYLQIKDTTSAAGDTMMANEVFTLP
ncbi:MAG TPA: hypothetical protein PK299_10305 [Anaerolineales bacterium]|nr:hypothetical protein [Anaerolineales bacterium]